MLFHSSRLVVVLSLFPLPGSLIAQDGSAVDGVWSGPLTAPDSPAWTFEDLACPMARPAAKEHCLELLADPANSDRALPELMQEVQAAEQQRFQELITDDYRAALGRRTPPAGDPSAQCRPPQHLWQVLGAPLPFSIEVLDGEVVLHHQNWNIVRTVQFERAGPQHESIDMGSAIARLEGSALVIESRELPAHTTGQIRMTEGARIVERYTPAAEGTRLAFEHVIEDSESFREPYVEQGVFVRLPDAEIFQHETCQQTQR